MVWNTFSFKCFFIHDFQMAAMIESNDYLVNIYLVTVYISKKRTHDCDVMQKLAFHMQR